MQHGRLNQIQFGKTRCAPYGQGIARSQNRTQRPGQVVVGQLDDSEIVSGGADRLGIVARHRQVRSGRYRHSASRWNLEKADIGIVMLTGWFGPLYLCGRLR